MEYAYEDIWCKLIQGDSFQILEQLPKQSFDMIFADPPYFLSNNGITCHSGTMVSVNKGVWDSGKSIQQKYQFNKNWIHLCKALLKPEGTIWISGTFHNIYSIGMALEEEGFHIINNITWQKTNPPPNLACKCFTHSTETILWACLPNVKGEKKYYFDYQEMKQQNGNKQMKDVWSGSLTKPSEKRDGKHPTQKPLYLLERIIQASTKVGDMILDPFSGSSTTGVAAKRLRRRFLGIEKEKKYIELSRKRLQGEE